MVTNCVGEAKRLTFHIPCRTGYDEKTALSSLATRMLYHLRMQHPVIDAVGVFDTSDTSNCGRYLVMIQVSLSRYSVHESKATNIYNKLCRPESTAAKESTIAEYYKNLAGVDDAHTVYVYVSPSEPFEGKTSTLCHTLQLQTVTTRKSSNEGTPRAHLLQTS